MPRGDPQKHVERVRRLCVALPETWEKLSHGEPTFSGLMFATRIFDELSARWPLLKTNKAFQEKVDHLRRVLRHAGTTLLNDDH